LIELLIRWRAEAVLERYSLASGPARNAAASLSLPFVLEVNAPLVLEAARYRGLTDLERWLAHERQAFSSADAIGVVSRSLVDYVGCAAPGSDAVWIPNGVDTSTFAEATPAELDLPADAVAVGFVGSMKGWHGTSALVDAVAELGDASRVYLVLAGDGPEAALVERRITERRLGNRTRWLGHIPHHCVPSLLRALDIGVAPYVATRDFYFSPLKVLEYMAAGLPVVCPALGDLPALVGDAGCLYSPADADGLAAALRSLVEDPERRRLAAVAARARAATWDWDANAAMYERLLTDAAARCAPAHVASAHAELGALE
jgi:glycosyltransferase involved in cell wall biosynthesis